MIEYPTNDDPDGVSPGGEEFSNAIMFGCVLNKEDRIGAQWFMNLVDSESENPHANISAVLVEKVEDKKFVLAWRIRLIIDDSITKESKDPKMFARNVCSTEECTREQAMEKAKAVVKSWEEIWGCEVLSYWYDWCTAPEMYKMMVEKPPDWIQVTKVPKEEVSAELKEKVEEQNKRNKYRI